MEIKTGRERLWEFVAKSIAISFCYAMTGKLGLLLAVPPGYATAIFPPSGVALTAILFLGYRFWPAVWLGSFLFNIPIDALSTNFNLLKTLFIPGCIGVGATLQAVAGAHLIRRLVKYPITLDKLGEIAKFFLIGGPCSCFIASIVGVTTLLLAGAIRPESCLMNWFTWLVGDSLGVIVITTLLLSWFAEPASLWRSRKWTVALPISMAFIISVII
ncbi:MAG: MASE1 domain-containing protein, partial [Deltaproteobacteria bacterium]|nr:MASE1 domain-containing protein [Deltaproteobacteria bacterium]